MFIGRKAEMQGVNTHTAPAFVPSYSALHHWSLSAGNSCKWFSIMLSSLPEKDLTSVWRNRAATCPVILLNSTTVQMATVRAPCLDLPSAQLNSELYSMLKLFLFYIVNSLSTVDHGGTLKMFNSSRLVSFEVEHRTTAEVNRFWVNAGLGSCYIRVIPWFSFRNRWQ